MTAVVYWLVGVCAYAVFRQRTAGDVLRNFGGADVTGMRGAYERAIKACFALAVLGSIPLAILPFYTIVQPLLRGGGGACGAAAAACGGAAAAACGGAAGGAPGPRGRGAGAHLKARLSGGSGDGAPPGRAPAVIRSKDLREQGSGPLPGAGADDDEWAAVVTGSEVGGRSGAEPRRRTAAPDGGEALPVSSPPLHGGGGAGGGHAHARGGGGDVPPGAPSPSSGSMLGPHLDPHLTAHDAEVALSFPQHALLTFLLLGTGMAAALWLPNLEFIFGLTGATTSVVIAFIMPALCFLRLAGPDPEVAFGGFGVAPAKGGAAGAAAAGVGGVPVAGGKPGLLAPPELRAAWVWRRRVARALLAFGLVAGVLCTHATLSSIQEEAAVVQLAQELVAHEVVVAEAAHAQIKAKEAAAAISVVQVGGGRQGGGARHWAAAWLLLGLPCPQAEADNGLNPSHSTTPGRRPAPELCAADPQRDARRARGGGRGAERGGQQQRRGARGRQGGAGQDLGHPGAAGAPAGQRHGKGTCRAKARLCSEDAAPAHS